MANRRVGQHALHVALRDRDDVAERHRDDGQDRDDDDPLVAEVGL